MSDAFRDLYEDDDEYEGVTFEAIAELEYDAETGELVTLRTPLADRPFDVPDGSTYLTAGQSTPPSAAGFAPFSEWVKQQRANVFATDPQYEDAPASEPGPFDEPVPCAHCPRELVRRLATDDERRLDQEDSDGAVPEPGVLGWADTSDDLPFWCTGNGFHQPS